MRLSLDSIIVRFLEICTRILSSRVENLPKKRILLFKKGRS
ncbi:hypothetical protein [Balnearium lithotrophicum]|nr:hypothetical protein [Balnearium lithotrophicum]